jgi:general secretion pathway protein L
MTATLNIKGLAAAASLAAMRLLKAAQPLQRLLFFSPADEAVYPRSCIAVAVERGRLSVVVGSAFLSRVTVRGVREYTFDGSAYPEPNDVASSLALALNEFGMTGQAVTLSIPKSWVVVASAGFPSTVREDLPSVVAYELDRITPFSSDDAYFDFTVLKEKDERVSLQVTAARTDTVRPYIRALEENGIAVNRLAVNLSGLGSLCQRMEKTGDCIVMQVAAGEYETGLFLQGALVEAGSGRVGPLDDAPAMARVMLPHLQALAASAQAEGKKPAVSVVLKDMPAALAEVLKIQTDLPLKILSTADTGIRFLQPPKEMPYVAAGSLLEGLGSGPRGLNLLRKGITPPTRVPILLTVILLCCLAALGILYMVTPLRFEERRLREVSRQVTLRKDEVRKVEALKKEGDALAAELGTIEGFKKDRLMSIAIMKELTTVLPKTAWLTRTRVTDTAVELEGYASSATELLPKLEASPYFRKVEFASPTFRDARMNSDRFVIKMEIEGAKKPEEKPREEKPAREKK